MNEFNFDDFLSEVNEQDAQDRARDAYFQELRQRLDVAILVHNLPRVVDMDENYQTILHQDAVRQLEILLREVYREYHVEFDTQDIEDVYVTNRAEHYITLQALQQASWLTSILVLIASHDLDQRQAPAGVTVEPNSAAKKHFIATVLISGTITPNDPWFTFMNDVIPGDPFDPEDPDAEPYLIAALETHANHQEEVRQLEAVFAEARRIAGIDGLESKHPQRQQQAIGRLIQEGIITQRLKVSSDPVHAIAQRQSDLMEICRGVFDQATTTALIAYVDAVYPITK